MNKEEAIKAIQDFIGWFKTDSRIYKALKMALQALSQEPTDENLHREREQAYMQGYEDASKKYRQEPCTDAVSRQAVLDAIDVKAWEFCDYLISKNRNDEQKPVSHFADTLRECVREELPPVNPQPKTGYREYNDIYDHYLCGNCKTVVMDYDNFCPNCGYRMVEPQESEEI